MNRPGPISPTTSFSTVTDACLTRWIKAFMIVMIICRCVEVHSSLRSCCFALFEAHNRFSCLWSVEPIMSNLDSFDDNALPLVINDFHMHLLIVTHDLSQGAHVKRGLKYENLDADILLYSAVNVSHAEGHIYSAIILHHNHEDTVCFDTCLWMRASYPHTPIIILDDRPNMEERAEFLREGVRAYFGRPFSFRDLGVQIKCCVYKQSGLLRKKMLRYEDLRLYLETREVHRDGKRIDLCNKEFALLEFFMLNMGQVLTRNDILENVWDHNTNIMTNTVDVHVNKIRRKIGGDRVIHTVPCVGYRFGEKPPGK
jgi:two-component system, OmpR family, copper resistance phosphate regulon response regulator CusR